jgi:hypothetical protein
MNQILNIFRKDSRHLRLEILASLTVLVLYDIFEPKSWVNALPMMEVAGITSMALGLLLCISWGLLVIRVVQTERLAGLNQFWTTRPYEWPKLLAAKCLFLLVYLYAPLVLSQILLLHLGGFAIAPNLPQLLLNLLLLSACLLLPLVCVAAVTTSFGQAILALLGALLTFVLLVAVASGRNLQPLFLIRLQLGIEIVMLTLVVLYQYRRRGTRNTILLYAATVVLLISTQWLLPGSSLAVAGYALPTQNVPVSIAIDSNPPDSHERSDFGNPTGHILVRVPLVVSGIVPGTSFRLEGQEVHLQGSNGFVWDSHWESANGIFEEAIFSGSHTPYTMISLPRSVYDKLSGRAVSINLTFAVAQLQDLPVYQSVLSSQSDNAVPGLGYCGLDDMQYAIHCRSVYASQADASGSEFSRGGPCDGPPQQRPARRTIGWVTPRQWPNTVAISPVTVLSFGLGRSTDQYGHDCRNSQIIFAQKHLVRRFQAQTPTISLILKDYYASTLSM